MCVGCGRRASVKAGGTQLPAQNVMHVWQEAALQMPTNRTHTFSFTRAHTHTHTHTHAKR
ncbi:hypothetical protein EON66_01675 [archaeon]|nr:MAG: hypothetical protein EON66_01675 [archaeon]